jgi:hypothetical protein
MKNKNINFQEKNNIENQDIYNEKENIISDKKYENFIYFYNYIIYLLKFLINISGIYIVWIFLHYFASHLYIKLCVPNSIIGFILSPFMTSTPQCQGLRWLIYNGANIINNMWTILGTWIAANILNHK